MFESMRRATHCVFTLLVVLAASIIGSRAWATGTMTLTPYALTHSAGPFTLTTFASGFVVDPVGAGPLGVAYVHDVGLNLDKVLVTDYGDGNVYTFPSHADNQIAGPGLITANYGAIRSIDGLAQIQVNNLWRYYATQQDQNRVIEVNAAGQFVRVVVSIPICIGITSYAAGIVNGHAGHLFVSDDRNGNIWEVDPAANTKTIVKSGLAQPDGLSISADGNTIYAALLASHVVQGYNLATGAVTWTSPVTASIPDGVATGTGTLTGLLYANCNNGEVWEFGVPPHAPTSNLIASGGTRGDFIATDPNSFCAAGHPSLLLTQSDRILRLDPPGGGWFGGPASSTAPVITGPAIPTVQSVPGVSGSGLIALCLLMLAAGGLLLRRRKPSLIR